MTSESKHEHPGGEIPHRHNESDELATHDSGRTSSERPATGEQTLELREEQLRVHTEPIERGTVRIGKEVVEEQQTLNVPVTREEVTIERHAVDRRPAEGAIGADEQTIQVPIRQEQVELDKRAVVTEEINVGKRQVQETEQVSDTVRREEARIEREGDVHVDDRR
jgi:uncharacterized protein (TIGR02271 family)